MDELDILLWGLGAQADIPLFREVKDERLLYLLGADEEQVIERIHQHRITGRFLQRALQEHPGWCSNVMLSRLSEMRAAEERRSRTQIAALRELACMLAPKDLPLMVVKGPATYAITQVDAHKRLSADLDLLAPDPEAVYGALQRLGYQGERQSDHEFAVMHRGDMMIELHRHFPIWQYPKQFRYIDYQTRFDPRPWLQPAHLPERADLSYEDLAHNAVQTAILGNGIVVPCPAMAILIQCGHMFRHYAEGQRRSSPMVRLSELADIRDLAHHHGFDASYFWELAHRYGGTTSVSFARYLLQTFLGTDIPGAVHARKRLNWVFPMQSSKWGGWALVHSPEEVFSQLSTTAAFQRLQPTSIFLGECRKRHTHGAHRGVCPECIRKVITCVQPETTLSIEFSVSEEDDALLLSVRVFKPVEPGCAYYVLASFRWDYPLDGILRNGRTIRWAEIDDTGSVRNEGVSILDSDGHNSEHPAEGAVASRETDGCRVRLPFAWQLLCPTQQKSSSVPLLLTVGWDHPAHERRIHIVVPIEIDMRPSASL